MIRHPIISVLISIISSLAIAGVVFLVFSLLTFNLAGGETLSKIENQHLALFILAFIFFIISILLVKKYKKKNKKYTAAGVTIVACMVLIAAAVYLYETNYNYTAFNKTIWMQADWKPNEMAASLVKEKTLIGLTSTAVEQMLGKPANKYGDSNRSSFVYHATHGWTFSVIFSHDTVIETGLRLPYLDL